MLKAELSAAKVDLIAKKVALAGKPVELDGKYNEVIELKDDRKNLLAEVRGRNAELFATNFVPHCQDFRACWEGCGV